MTSEQFDNATLYCGDCRTVMAEMIANGQTYHSIITDPPYHLTSTRGGSKGFMGREWDGGDIAFQVSTWKLAYDLLLPGGYLLAFGGTRTYHRMVCAIEDAGFEIRDTVMWMYGTGFPKSLDVSKAIDKHLGAEREVCGRSSNGIAGGTGEFTAGNASSAGYRAEYDITMPATFESQTWQGWGTSLKPAVEPIVMARKPFSTTVAANVLEHGCGGINIDACRVPTTGETFRTPLADPANRTGVVGLVWQAPGGAERNHAAQRASIERLQALGRWPANVIHDGSDEVLDAFGQFGHSKSTDRPRRNVATTQYGFGGGKPEGRISHGHTDSGTAARFMYCAKASKRDRAGSRHPTVKPLSLMAYLCKLVTAPGGRILDPFCGSGTTLQAGSELGFQMSGIEMEPEYQDDIRRRLATLP